MINRPKKWKALVPVVMLCFFALTVSPPALCMAEPNASAPTESVQMEQTAQDGQCGNIGEIWPEALEAMKANSMPKSVSQTPPTSIIPQLMPGTKMETPDIFISTESNGVSLIIEKVSIILCQDIPAEIQIPVIVSVISPGKAIKLEEVAAASSDHKPLLNKKMDRILQNTGKALDPSDLKRDYTALCKVINTTGTALTEIKVPLAGLAVEKGKPFDLQVSAKIMDDEKPATLTVTTTIILASLPIRSGWYCGDGHMHSNWKNPGSPEGDDGFYDIPTVIQTMKNMGYLWTIMTPHMKAINNLTAWNNFWSSCDSAQSSKGIPVCPGVEIASVNDAHALAYWQRKDKMPPDEHKYSESELITRITEQNSGYSYGGLAHPNGYYYWNSWPSNSRTAELINNSYTIDWTTYNEWLEHLKNNLSTTLSTGAFCAAVGNSDYHLGTPGGCTWLYNQNYASNQRGPIWAAIKAGRTSASGRGNLGVFAVNGYVQGSVLRNPSSLQFYVVQQPISGAFCKQFAIYDKNSNIVYMSQTNPPETTNVTLPVPSSDNFYYVYFVFFHDPYGNITSDVITSPIFVDR